MDLRLQPKPEVECTPANSGIVSRKQFFVQKEIEEIRQYFSAGHLIRDWKPKAELIYPPPYGDKQNAFEYDFNREVQNCFIDDNAEEVFLRTPPPCFVIFGKFKREMNNFAKALAQQYGSVLIEVDDVVNTVLEMDSETSKVLHKILSSGNSITLNFSLALASYVAHTTVARHRGYILSGLPCTALPDDLSPEDQFNYIFTWDNKPTVFIHALFEDEDLITQRTNSRLSIIRDKEKQDFIFFRTKIPIPEESDSDDDEIVPQDRPSDYEPDINISPSKTWLELPNFEESQIWDELEEYNNNLKPAVQSFISKIDPQYLITIDSRIGNPGDIVAYRLNLLQIWAPPSAKPFFGTSDTNELDNIKDEPPQTAFLKLFNKNVISPKFRWELSHYNYICPVTLREGKIMEGKTEFAVTFMKYIYFLLDEKCMKKFIENPRAFALPIRPKPLCRFIILGYPLSGKTTLANALSEEYSIPVIDYQEVLESDVKRKKQAYLEFCKHKAECWAVIRRTTLAWEDWRKEEEKRLDLIEEWILYIRGLLKRRIKEFYQDPNAASDSEESEDESGVSGEISSESSGSSNESDANYKKKTNMFLSSVWQSFSKANQNAGVEGEAYGEDGDDDVDGKSVEVTINWCNLLPPQSLSSILIMSKGEYTNRKKREAFKIFLEAASKVYWESSALKLEFAKWRLPCYMDIPLCELFLENPLLLLKYVPVWLKERPLIPNPIEKNHPQIVRAVSEATKKATIVRIKQTEEDIAILLHRAIEKAERDGMRTTGDIWTPGGWVLDNMTLDLKIWKNLAYYNVFPDHIYILVDTEPNYQRILRLWWELCGNTDESSTSEEETEDEDAEVEEEIEGEEDEDDDEDEKEGEEKRVHRTKNVHQEPKSMTQILIEMSYKLSEGEHQLDMIFDDCSAGVVTNEDEYFSLFKNYIKSRFEFPRELSFPGDLNTKLYKAVVHLITQSVRLGTNLEVVTKRVLNYFKINTAKVDATKNQPAVEEDQKFFQNLLTIEKKLKELKKFLTSLDRGPIIEEIEMTGKTPEEVFQDIKKKLMAPFIKKPRELEEFEMRELEEKTQYFEKSRGIQSISEQKNDIRIFGESGQLCVVNLERNVYVLGKLQYSLRYCGKLYYFWNQEAKNKFIENPEKYAPYYSAIRCYPPLRLYVIGPAGSGKTTIASALSRQFGVAHIEYPKFLVSRILPHSDLKTVARQEDFKLLLSDNHNSEAKSAMQMFLNLPYSSRQFWIENSSVVHHFTKEALRKKIEEMNMKIHLDYPELNYSFIEPNRNRSINDQRLEFLSDIPYTSLKDVESILYNYINNGTELSEYCIDRSLKTLWTSEPYLTKGFILDNYPMRIYDVRCVTENNWFPDLVIELSVPEKVVVNRNINNLMELWETKLNEEIKEETLLEETVENIQKILVSFQREELLKQLNAKKDRKSVGEFGGEMEEHFNYTGGESEFNSSGESKNMAYESEEENEVERKAEMMLKEKNPPLVFKPIFETYDAAKQRLAAELLKNYTKDLEEIRKIKSEFSELGIPWKEIDGKKNLHKILSELCLEVDKIRKRAIHKGEFAFPMSNKVASELLRQGFYFLSKFGRWCPVQVYRMTNPINMYLPLGKRRRVIPIAYRNYIYFVSGEKEQKSFLEDPVKYTFNEPQHPIIPLRVAVIGPPKSGKTTLSERLGVMFDLKVITMGSALRFVLENAPKSALSRALNSYLTRGAFPPLSLKVEALMLCLNDPLCVTQGFIFDGVPFDAALTQSLAEKGKLPFVILSLVADPHFGKTNRQKLQVEKFRIPYKNKVNLDNRYTDWKETYRKFSLWNQSTYNNLYELNAKLGPTEIFYQAYDIIRKSFFGILYYVQYCTTDRVLPLEYLCISQNEFNVRKSPLQSNCPVCWVTKGMLNKLNDLPTISGLVQYKHNFFWICPKHMEEFVKNPKKYYYPENPKWPEVLPQRLFWQTSPYNLNIYGNGRCPVTRTDFPKSLDWEGSPRYAAVYDGKVFYCKNEEMLSRFLSQPWKYCNADTKFEVSRHGRSKALENLGPPLMTSLPPVGFLEQTVAKLIHECLQLLGTVRPLYPNISPSVTGCIFVALYLKAHNKRHKASRLEKESFNFMLKTCPAFTFKVKQRSLHDVFMIDDTDDGPDFSEVSLKPSKTSVASKEKVHISSWMDIPVQVDNSKWFALLINERKTKMILTEDNTLHEIPIHPKHLVCVKLHKASARAHPFPPIPNCLTVLYSPKRNMTLPKAFNYQYLYQPLLTSGTDQAPKINFNLGRKFPMFLHKDSEEPEFTSATNLRRKPSTHFSDSVDKGAKKTPSDIDTAYMLKYSIPRFKLLDRVRGTTLPTLPKVIPDECCSYDPLTNYAYIMLMSDFFGGTHFVRNFNYNLSLNYREYWDRSDFGPKPRPIPADFQVLPKRTISLRTRTSTDDYQDDFDAATSFAIDKHISSTSTESNLTPNMSSTYDYMMSLLDEKLDEMFQQISEDSFSYNSFDVSITSHESGQEIVITETVPFPPLPWDILSRPYYAYTIRKSIWSHMKLEQITHKRRLSILEGLSSGKRGTHSEYLEIPKKEKEEEVKDSHSEYPKVHKYLYYDFFNLPWTSFLSCKQELIHHEHISEFSDPDESTGERPNTASRTNDE